MPTYEFQCPECGERKEVWCKPTELDASKPTCEHEKPVQMERIYTPTPGIVKGASAKNNYGLKRPGQR